MPKIPSLKSFSNNKSKDDIPIPPFNHTMPPPSTFTHSNKNIGEQLQLFHQQHFMTPTLPINLFMPYPFHPLNNNTSINSNQSFPLNQGTNEEINSEEEEEEYDENFEKEISTSGSNKNKISFVLSKETIEMFRHSELYRKKLKEEQEKEEERRLQKEKEEEQRLLKIYQEHNKGYEEHLEIYGDFKLKLMEDTLNEEFKKKNMGELWPILPLNE
ncbi:hypothetical protein BCR36DRAFT_414496 [Piromyces finnis]|uniref:Uncharacterized protein n=1 Tax=Piromyces finnis TaxID=1754191 RepID=A0A1Y1V3I4_9FUNG|nr:hypothetical protein BCR36DRAFT_414496 [Piromyces finnis]|eukprot:ORX45634.1 hypothetical protein BCR36DRAFT_414496 [Piromyces finnis]